MIYPTQRGLLAGNPRDSAIEMMNNTNAKQSAVLSTVGGWHPGTSVKRKGKRIPTHKKIHSIKSKRKSKSKSKSKRKSSKRRLKKHMMYTKKRNHYGGVVSVPQFNMLYTSQAGPGSTPNDIIKTNAQTSTQSAANSVYDQYAFTK